MGGPPKYASASAGGWCAPIDVWPHLRFLLCPIRISQRCQDPRIAGRSTARGESAGNLGTKGKAIPEKGITEGPNKWKYESQVAINPYEQEHKDLVESIRAGKPLNEGKQTAESALTAIMGRMSAYTGKVVTFKSAMDSSLDLFPKKLEFGPCPCRRWRGQEGQPA
jgi:hypothetical protein